MLRRLPRRLGGGIKLESEGGGGTGVGGGRVRQVLHSLRCWAVRKNIDHPPRLISFPRSTGSKSGFAACRQFLSRRSSFDVF
jgi:hypothetical protein